MESKLQAFLLPLCQARDKTNILEKIGTNPIFDRNVIGLVAQFAVCLTHVEYAQSFTLYLFFSKVSNLTLSEHGGLKTMLQADAVLPLQSLLGRKIEAILIWIWCLLLMPRTTGCRASVRTPQ